MRVTLFTQYFSPEIGATQTRLHTFARGLAKRNHHVRVVCEVPNHPQGVVHPDYQRRPFVRRDIDGFEVLHVWVKTDPVKTARSRLAFYGSYAAAALGVGVLSRKPDVVLASSPPLPVALAGALVAKRHRVPWVMDVRDLWPAAAVALGELASRRTLDAAQRLESWLYGDAAAITVVTQPFHDHVVRRCSGSPVHIVPNGTNEQWLAAAKTKGDRAMLGLSATEFLWVFAGNIGSAQGLETAVDAAALLGNGFRLLILGDGPSRARLEARAERNTTGAVEFRGQVVPELAIRYLTAADGLLVSLADHPVLLDFVPSKLYDCCAVGTPVVLAAGGEAARLAAEHDAALIVPPGEPHTLADAVRHLAEDGGMRQRLSTSGRLFAALNMREDQVERLEGILDEVVAAP